MGCDRDLPGEADTVLFGAPFDSTTSYRPGARFGSGAIRRGRRLDWKAPAPIRTGIFGTHTGHRQRRPGSFLSGRHGGSTPGQIEACGQTEILAAGKRPFPAGRRAPGHPGRFPCSRGAPVSRTFAVIHFDAHTDLREDYLGVPLSHACVIRRCWELAGDDRIHQFGIRSGDIGKSSFSERSIPIFMPLPLKVLQRLWIR